MTIASQKDSPGTATVVVPCHNEAKRLDEWALGELAASGRVELLFVDDGSRDATPCVLERIAKASPSTVRIHTLPTSLGKAEAVRRGMRLAIQGGAQIVGYYDADLSTPPAELLGLLDRLASDPHLTAVIGARIRRLGSSITRRPLRHYVGRVYATVASLALGIGVYDTQCGAKVFRVTPQLERALADPFVSPWAFDVVLLARLLDGDGEVAGLSADTFFEEPLGKWRDVAGSKMRLVPGILATAEVVALGARRALRRSRRHRQPLRTSHVDVLRP